MAARRPPSSRTRSNNTMPPPAAQGRSRSVMSSSILSAEESHPETTVVQTFHSKNQKQPQQEDVETNIQVVIRCRRRSEREIQDNSPIIVSSSGPKGHDVTIETSTPVSSLGIVTLPPTRTYPFDLVFGPEADQAMIYHDVVSPMLDQVLMGYNCTLFAYGQTGTGKTYTMQGDLTPTPMGNPSAQAGMIPRVLFRLFHHLESSVPDYSVKISFIELYNEELRDLLANELSAPNGTAQPMGMGSDPASKDNVGLKIFDDTSKRGVFIQGLEEVCVKDASDALALLTKGSHRRQIAATRFNDHSSRSHSVFSITVHIKETSNMGDDLLKIGKLNLVDLAGSENIGRSGAENKRAREAGMINQSLLTLGRVINALVDKAQHVPYRESKLTRLLRDSLGGRTKTCIIATISPARSNMEETLSTLEYAIRAKNIRNKPELNQRMTRNSLLKEYVAEIERLKADVLAAREKNGIFFSEETWNQLSAEQELRQTEIEEARKQVEIVESQMRSVREEFEQSIALLTKREGELKETKEKLKETEGELVAKAGELNVVKNSLEEEVVIRQAYQETEVILDEVAGGLKKVAKESMKDVGGLFEKLHRKTTISSSNSKAILTHGKTISSETNILSAKLEEFIKSSSQNTLKLRTEAAQFQTKELDTLTAHSERINAQLQRVQEALEAIQDKEAVSSEALGVVQSIVKETHESLKTGFGAWGDSLKKTCEAMCREVEASGATGFTTVEKALKAMGSVIEAIVREAREYVNVERESVLQVKALANTSTGSEMARLRQQNEMLTRLLESERINADRAKDELIQRVSGLLGQFTRDRDKGLRAAVGVMQQSNEEAEGEMRVFDEKHESVADEMSRRAVEVDGVLERRSGEGKRTRDGAVKALSSAKQRFGEELTKTQGAVSGSIQTYSGQVQKQTQAMNVTSTDAFDRHARAKRARIETTNAMTADVLSEYRYLQRGIASTSRNIDAAVARVVSESSGLANTTQMYHKTASKHMSTMQQATRTMVEQGTKEDIPSGMTPRKRVWQYTEQWDLTRDRQAILKSWRDGIPNVGGGTSVAEPDTNEENDLDAPDEAGMTVNEPTTSLVISDHAQVFNPMESPIAAMSLASSLSSSVPTPIPVPRHAPVLKKPSGLNKSVLPTMGTLTDRSTNVLTNRPRKVRQGY